MSEPLALRADGLRKRYGDREVVRGLDLACPRGRVLGLLGPNGAGKTTTLRMLYGYLRPDGGTIRYGGRDFAQERDALRRTLGVCTQEDSLDYDLDVEQNLRVYARYFRPAVPSLDRRIDQLLEEFGLTTYRSQSPHALSGGYKRRLMIARSVIHGPDVLFLDEPTTGLDPRARLDVWQLVRRMRDQGLAVVLTTHYMDEAERLSDELLVVNQGERLSSGPPREVLASTVGAQVLVIRPGDASEAAMRAFAEARGLATHPVLDELHVALRDDDLVALRAVESSAGARLRDPTLDDLFLSLSVSP